MGSKKKIKHFTVSVPNADKLAAVGSWELAKLVVDRFKDPKFMAAFEESQRRRACCQ